MHGFLSSIYSMGKRFIILIGHIAMTGAVELWPMRPHTESDTRLMACSVSLYTAIKGWWHVAMIEGQLCAWDHIQARIVVATIIIIIIISFIIVTCARHPADTTAYKSLIHIDIHLLISLHTKNMLPNILTIRSTTIVISSRSSVKEHTSVCVWVTYKPWCRLGALHMSL